MNRIRVSAMHGREHAGRPSTPSIDDLARDIAERLRPVCTYCDEEEFAGLVRRIATVELKYKLSGERPTGDGRGDGRGARLVDGLGDGLPDHRPEGLA